MNLAPSAQLTAEPTDPAAPAGATAATPATSAPLGQAAPGLPQPPWPGMAWVSAGPHRLHKGPVRKKIAPQQPGAGRWAERFGQHLVCVRYRDDPDRQRRVVTVELLVDERPLRSAPVRPRRPPEAAPAPAQPPAQPSARPPEAAPHPALASAATTREPPTDWVGLHFGVGQPELVRKAQSVRALWNPRTRQWVMPRRTAHALDLLSWVVDEAPTLPTPAPRMT